ncbi:hypothetical protein UABAM_05457 [Candidatus Uabimicrobium amorphum]|uniref:Potassium channel domain-containing protein n=2 Tax=Uabimicrobium amorphum TaxID=2596890 RepID=A0A5S9ISE9_UABAM|nr:hypothetical protein UABAM_05457 [Candidatus Uabimicrobium amorphum]
MVRFHFIKESKHSFEIEMKNSIISSYKIIKKQRFILVLFCLFILIFVIAPLSRPDFIGCIGIDASISILLIVSLFFVTEKTFVLALLATFSVLLIRSLLYIFPSNLLVITSNTLSFILLIVVTMNIFVLLSQKNKTDIETLAAAISVYLMIGLIFGFIYATMHHLNSLYFSFKEEPLLHQFSVWLYYSFVTLTTLGYGDIVPLSPFAKMLSCLEAILGQMYLAITIAHVVGLRINAGRYRDSG